MHARVLEGWPKNIVLDRVKGDHAPGREPLLGCPHTVDLPDAVSRVQSEHGAADRIVIDDRSERDHVVRVDPERQPLLPRPSLLLAGQHVGDLVDDTVEHGPVGHERSIVDSPVPDKTRQKLTIRIVEIEPRRPRPLSPKGRRDGGDDGCRQQRQHDDERSPAKHHDSDCWMRTSVATSSLAR